MKKTTTKTPRTPRTVTLSTYLQSITIAVLATSIVAFGAGYYTSHTMQAERSTSDAQVKKAQQ